MNFITYAPGIYDERGGGCIALHKLAHNIAELGERSFIMSDSKNPKYKGELIDEATAKELAKGDSIVIYPEVICGNPLQAKNVMRWILYYVRETGEHGLYGENDLIFKYAPHFTLRREQQVHGELRAVELNMDLFVDRGEERSGACYLVKKEPDKAHIHPEGSIGIDEYPERGGFKYLADMFNYCETFYAYDTATWLSIMATQCGCLSIVVPRDGVTAEDWYREFPYFKYGIAYGLEQVEHAKATQHLVKENLLAIEAATLKQTKEFIELAYKL